MYRKTHPRRALRLTALLLALLLALTTLCACEDASLFLDVPADAPEATLEQTAAPTAEPTPTPAPEPTQVPTLESTLDPTPEPTLALTPEPTPALDPEGVYTSKEDVALYLHLYGELPGNFITKSQARDLGWPGGSLEPYAPGKCIGGSRFGNYEGLLPDAPGRTWTECDIDTLGADSRGAKRIVFSNDGLIYYTGDHYESFELLYEPE